jgi:cystathionine beta-lyase
VLHPALPDCPGHDIWKRDFTGSTSVFSIVFRPDWTPARIIAWMESLTLFRMGFSWGGVASLVMTYPGLSRLPGGAGARLVRLNIGLEDTDDLKADMAAAFERIAAAR